MAEFTSHRKGIVAVFNAADKALYKAKEKGEIDPLLHTIIS